MAERSDSPAMPARELNARSAIASVEHHADRGYLRRNRPLSDAGGPSRNAQNAAMRGKVQGSAVAPTRGPVTGGEQRRQGPFGRSISTQGTEMRRGLGEDG